MPDKLKVFISCVSPQFKACREALASDLRAIGCEVKAQEDFQQGPDTLIAQIEAYVAQCDRVIALAGDAYGCEVAKDSVPATEPPRSYTQWEYYFALGERLNGQQAQAIDRYVYFASRDYLDAHPVAQSAEYTRYQSKFRQMIKASGKHRGEFGSVDQLCRLVLRDGWQMHERPAKPCNLPYESLGSLLKGRDGFMADLHEHLQQNRGQATAVVAKQAIHGLGGVGKTRLAVEYAWRFAADYCALLFVNAGSGEALNRNLAALCGPKLLNLTEQEATEEDIRTAAALRWFTGHSGWLLILDNADTPAAAEAVEGLFSQLQAGHVLVTSRLPDWSGGVDTMELDVLEESDAVAFILERTQQRRTQQATDAADALALARELDGLALALEQAGAFIEQKRLSISDYLHPWRQREAKVREWFDERLMHYPRSVAVTWDTSVQQLDAVAFGLLRILCWFAPDPVPRALLSVASAGQELAGLLAKIDGNPPTSQRIRTGTWLARILALIKINPEQKAKADLEEALAMLAAYSLVRWEDGNTAFRLHRLVADVTRSRVALEQRLAWLTAALNWVDAYLPADSPPDDIRSWPLWLPLRSHLSALIETASTENIGEPTARLASDLGLLLKNQALWHEAEPLMRRALAISESSYGSDHPNVATALNNLAILLKETTRLAEAEPLMRRSLAIDESSYGAWHPRVAIDLNNLASLLQETNRLAEAEPLMRRALAIVETRYGADHPEVAIRLNNLATLLMATNRLAEAEPLMRRALEIYESSYGAGHPNVAIGLNNLAQLLKATNRLAEAEPLMRRALAIDESSYGAMHPNVAIRLNNLAQLLQATNRLAEAEPLMRRALAIDESIYGAGHPDVAIDLNNLALLLQDTNLLAEAEPLMRRSLEIIFHFCVNCGHEHPNLQASIGNYTMLLQQTGSTETEALKNVNVLAKACGLHLGDGG